MCASIQRAKKATDRDIRLPFSSKVKPNVPLQQPRAPISYAWLDDVASGKRVDAIPTQVGALPVLYIHWLLTDLRFWRGGGQGVTFSDSFLLL